ncbi:hypothetical protein MMA231_03231 [Asticcacaulis sp. MM231]
MGGALPLISLLASFVVAASAATTSSPAGLSGLDTVACEGDGDARRLPRQNAITQLLARYPIVMDVADFSAPPVPLAQRVAKACADEACQTDGSLAALNRAVTAMLSTRDDGRLRLSWAGQGPEPATRPEQVAAFFDLSRDTYVLQCLTPPPPPPVIATAPADPKVVPEIVRKEKTGLRRVVSHWRIASTVNETEKDDYTSRDPARLSYVDNASDNAPVISAKGVIAAPAVLTWGDQKVATQGFGDIRPFVGYERISSLNIGNEVNNLDVGLRGHFRFARNDGKEAYIGGLTAAYETDDRLQSSLTRFEASLGLPLKAWTERTFPGNASVECVLCQTANMTLVSDYVDVSDPGAKLALLDLPQYARLGFDASWDVRLNRGKDKPGFGLNLQYSRRDDLSHEGATATRLISRAAYYPTPKSHYVFALEYDKGKDLTSLSAIDRWMLTWGYRQ